MTGTGDISVGVKSFMRTDKLRLCLGSLLQHEWDEVVVADDGPIDEERARLYREVAERAPLKVLRLPFDTGLSAGRNEIVRQCRTPYLLMLEDDQTVPANVGRLAEVLDENPAIGGVSAIWLEHGERKCAACDIRLVGSKMVKEVREHHQVHQTSLGQRFVTFDFIPNSTLFRKECLTDSPWDPFYKTGREHLDFCFSQQRLGRWQFAVSLDVVIGHHPDASSASDRQVRHGERARVSDQYFLQKFGLSDVVEGRTLHDDWRVSGKDDTHRSAIGRLFAGIRHRAPHV